MGNNKNIVSDKNLKSASGGEVKFNEETENWDVIDDDSKELIMSTDEEYAAKLANTLYHHGKRMGYLDGLEAGMNKAMNEFNGKFPKA